MTEREKCPHCGQPMPLTGKGEAKERLRIDRSTIVQSSFTDGALAWFIENEEGGTIGQDARLSTAALRKMFKKAKEIGEREGYAVEIAAKILAEKDGAEFSGRDAWVWRKPIKKRLIDLAEKILNGEDES